MCLVVYCIHSPLSTFFCSNYHQIVFLTEMATKTLFDFLDDVCGPIEQAEQAVREDDEEKLVRLLSPADNRQIIKEDTYVNSQAKENLLHFAVHQSAAICASLLCEKPYSWDVDRPNLIGRSPVQLAQLRGYAPVWYPLATHSCHAPLSTLEEEQLSQKFSLRTVTALLIQPQVFFRKPLEWSEEPLYFFRCFAHKHALTESGVPHFALSDSREEYDENLSTSNLKFLFELVIATPKVWSFDLHYRLPVSPHSLILATTTTFLSDVPLIQTALKQRQEQLVFDAWLYHRLQIANPDEHQPCQFTTQTSNSNQGSQGERLHSPFSLMEWCRMRIRQLATQKLGKCTGQIVCIEIANSGNGLCFTYPRLIAQLPLPPVMQTYLAYREFWPAWTRHTLPVRDLRNLYNRGHEPFDIRWFGQPGNVNWM
ncbi:hypothetical protein FGIG_02852 [Fasciola gigantica]|uniref:SOCS box domain-containing protein n=1 Tax=Fasciola gigantica TaxID=46835 RepID=A0A504Z3E6_FASGI|nr:hypothetical protein FGIG_02852 [Fasciola gigantica]